jgi:hypothetical protein
MPVGCEKMQPLLKELDEQAQWILATNAWKPWTGVWIIQLKLR